VAAVSVAAAPAAMAVSVAAVVAAATTNGQAKVVAVVVQDLAIRAGAVFIRAKDLPL